MGDIREKFEDIIKAHTVPDDILAAAVSGGADSMCLLSLCLNSSDIKKENLLVISVDHKIRGENSARDLEFVRSFCASRGVRFFPYAADIPARAKETGASVETAAREARYGIFEELICNGIGEGEDFVRPDKVLTAHHASDNVESILMHLFRGSGLNGICGMDYCLDGCYLRPLLDVSKEEIDAYVQEKKIPYITDETNADSRYTRNFIRNEVIPLIKQKYPGAEKAVINLSKEAAGIVAYIENEVDPAAIIIEPEANPAVIVPQAVKIRISALGDFVLASRYIIIALKKFKLYNEITREHIHSIIALKDAGNGSGFDLPYNYRAVREYDFITLYQVPGHIIGADSVKFEKKFAIGATDIFGDIVEVSKISNASALKTIRWKGCKGDPEKCWRKSENSLLFDLRKIPIDAVLRFRRTGDIFKPYGGGTKKLKEYLIDTKIPLRCRDALICLASGNEILAIIGVEISDKIKVGQGSDIYSIRTLIHN